MTARGITHAILAGFGGATAIIVAVLTTEATFGQ